MKATRKEWQVAQRVAPWLGLAVVALCARGIVAGWGREEVARPVAPANAPARSRPVRPPRPHTAVAVAAASTQAGPAAFVDLFPSQDWAPPPPPATAPTDVPAAPAQPPPLPFSIGALWLDGGGAFYAVLNAQGREFPVCVACRQSGFYREGDVLLGAYRIEKLSRSEVRFLYLPMKRRQRMALGG